MVRLLLMWETQNAPFTNMKIMKFLKEILHIIISFIENKKLYVNGICFEKTRNYRINQIYNYYYIIKNTIKFYKVYTPSEKYNKKFSDSIKHAKNASVSPLLRLNKLLKFLNIKFKDYNFLDLGSGQGISLHFVMDNYHFKNYYGLEFDEYLIDISKKNLFPLKKKFKIIHNDAGKFFLEDSRYVIYLYNPFDKIILKQFLENNLNLLKKNECIIIYQNNFHAKYIERISKKEILIENGLSIYYF